MSEAAHPPKQRTVLVVDDVSVDRKILSKCLERDGYSVSLAYDGRQALQLLRAQQGSIDLVGFPQVVPGFCRYPAGNRDILPGWVTVMSLPRCL
jgi:CheY-like chemotaxis protein